MGLTYDVRDLALIELAKTGTTEAPWQCLSHLHAKGWIEYQRGKPVLTAAGRVRAKKLKPCEASMKAMAVNATSGSAIRCVSGGSGFAAAPRKRK